MATHGPTVFPTLFQVWQRMGMHTHSVSSRTPTFDAATVVLSAILAYSDPGRQWSSQAASDPHGQRSSSAQPLSLSRGDFGELSSLAATFGELHSQASVFWYCLHLCGPRALSPFKFTQQSTSLLSCLVGKNICRVSLFEWVKVFKKPTVIVLIDNYIDRVKVKGSLYFRVYGMVRQTFWV